MRGYTTNFVNLIADNLRDRYDNGFPILKELLQNADDAKARSLIFDVHPGFPDSDHPLLRGSGLWFFNDGEFKESDADNLRSFGIGGKAGDASAIGNFGLGMKSVFHLCEALFYIAWDGERFHREGLTPWKQDGHDLHEEWEETSDGDWERLECLGSRIFDDRDGRRTWFLLWLPLRAKAHLLTQTGREAGAIINRFPGDDPALELAFLNDERLAYDVAEILPFLRHLKCVEHRGENNKFALHLSGSPRLMEDSVQQASGEVLSSDGHPLLMFSGRRIKSTDGVFAKMKAREEWPRTRYRDELGHERQAVDKTSPEAAILFCSGDRDKVPSRLQWAVFLPVDDGSEHFTVDGGKRASSIVLHGQFFLDAGRKQIHDLHKLHETPTPFDDALLDESLLRKQWNQRLAQDVMLPMMLPALADHTRGLREKECSAFTKAISESVWFRRFRSHVCRDYFWLRMLEKDTDTRWCLVEGDSRSRTARSSQPANVCLGPPLESLSKAHRN